jgi:hypothetical protein
MNPKNVSVDGYVKIVINYVIKHFRNLKMSAKVNVISLGPEQ